jgi:mono/diheme cytochrome c family protein
MKDTIIRFSPVFALILALFVYPPSLWSDENPAANPSPDETYQRYCAVCHGDRGDGQSRAMGSMVPPPRDFTLPEAAIELTRNRMIRSVREGRPGTAMGAWKHQLSEATIEALVDHVRTRFMVPVISKDAARGRRLYASHCSVCHGDRGHVAVWAGENMNPSPRNFTTENARAVLTRERMIRSVTYGRADTAMPGWGSQLSSAEVEAVVDYIRATFMRPDDERSAGHGQGNSATEEHAAAHAHDQTTPGQIVPDMSLPFPNGIVGDPTRGKEFYMANCVACHGKSGNGRGPRAYFIMPKPRNFTHAATRHSMNRPALFESIAMGTNGTEMPAWSKVIDAQIIADIAEFVFQRFIRPDQTSASGESG